MHIRGDIETIRDTAGFFGTLSPAFIWERGEAAAATHFEIQDVYMCDTLDEKKKWSRHGKKK